MPLQLTLYAPERFMTVLATGTVSRTDVDGFIDAMLDNGALAYRKLFDASEATTSITQEEGIELGMRFRSIHVGADVGALALVIPANRGGQLERMLGMIAAADRPMKVFTDIDRARDWIEEQIGWPSASSP